MAAELKKGEQVYFIPMGGSDTTGMLGYMDCARELDAQAKEQQIDGATVYVAVGSMGTYLGLVLRLESHPVEFEAGRHCRHALRHGKIKGLL